MVKIEELLGREPSRAKPVEKITGIIECPECLTPCDHMSAFIGSCGAGTSRIECGCGWGQLLEYDDSGIISYRAGSNGVDGIGCLECGSEIDDYGAQCIECARRYERDRMAEAFG